MPEFKQKVDRKYGTNLSKQYISNVEIGGAYAHHFYKFLDFLELKSLIITDLDSTKLEGGRYRAFPVNQSSHTSNVGLKKWFKTMDDNIPLVNIISKNDIDKISNFRRIAFEIPEDENTACGRSFEDAFIIANKNMFGLPTKTNNELEDIAFDKADDYSKSKANYAIEIALSLTDWKTPKYIEEGLIWLSKDIEKEEDK